MKKFIFAMLLFCSGLCANAQTTWSLRAGAGLGSGRYESVKLSTVLNLNSNVSLKRGSAWIFSPGLTVRLELADEDNLGVYVPLQFGYKAKMGERSIFIPKLGFAGGYMAKHEAVVGPCGELGFEIKHFTIGLDAYYSFVSPSSSNWYDVRYTNDYGLHLTFGYKF